MNQNEIDKMFELIDDLTLINRFDAIIDSMISIDGDVNSWYENLYPALLRVCRKYDATLDEIGDVSEDFGRHYSHVAIEIQVRMLDLMKTWGDKYEFE